MSLFSIDLPNIILGITIGICSMFFTGFLKKAGEDFYSWIKNTINPNASQNPPAQIVVHNSLNGNIEATDNEEKNIKNTMVSEGSSNITTEEIINNIYNAPPLQQNQIADNYIGIKATWDVNYISGDIDENGLVSIFLLSNDDKFTGICCKVLLNDYRELKVLQKGALVRVSGEISGIRNRNITLKNAKLQIMK